MSAPTVRLVAEPQVTGFPYADGYPSWLTWKAADGCEVTYGDDGDMIFSAPSGDKVITVSAPSPSGARWFETTEPSRSRCCPDRGC